MELIMKNLKGERATVKINDYVEVNGIVFKVTQLAIEPSTQLVLQPVNEDEVKKYLNTTTAGVVNAPKLSAEKEEAPAEEVTSEDAPDPEPGATEDV